MHGDAEFFKTLVTIVLAAFAFTFVGSFARIPSIVLYLIAGLVIGPLTGMALVTESHELIADIGIALMLFLVGLEMNIDKIRVLGKVGLLAGVGQVVLTFPAGFGLCLLLGLGRTEAAVMGVALLLSSTVVVIKLLEEKRSLDAFHGRIAVGILLVQDILVIILLTVLSGVGGGDGPDGLADVVTRVAQALGGMALLIGLVVVASRLLMPRVFGWAARSPQTLFVWSLAWCFLMVAMAHRLHLSEEVGAFLAGIGLAQLPYNRDLHRRVRPMMNFMIAVFFVSLGISMNLGKALSQWPLALVLSAFVLIGKFLIVWLIVSRLRFSGRTAMLSGVSLAQISEFSFIFLAMAYQGGLASQYLVALTGLVGLVTISASSFLILHDGRVVSFLRRLLRLDPAGREADTPDDAGLSGHVIVVGMNTLGRRIVHALDAMGETVLAIDTDPGKLADLPCRKLLGNVEYAGTLEEACLAEAKLIVSALQIEDTNEAVAFRGRLNGVPCSILAVDMNHMDELLDMGVDYLMVPKVDGIKRQNDKLRELGVLDP